MSGLSFNTNIAITPEKILVQDSNKENKTPTTVVGAKKDNFTDNVVDTSNKKDFAKDLDGAIKSGAKEIFFKGTDNVVHTMSVEVNEKNINNLLAQIKANPDFLLASISFTPTETKSTGFEANVNTANATVEKSNAVNNDKTLTNDDVVWKFMNGDATTVDKPGPTKPNAFYNSIQIIDGSVKVIAYGNDDVTSKMEGFPKTMDEFRGLLVKDFNFNGAITAFKEHGGEKTFIEQMKNNNSAGIIKMGEKDFELLCKNVYSYATEGKDIGGKTDIAEMQAMLYVLNPKISESSNSNTKMTTEGIIDKNSVPKGKENEYMIIGDKAIPKGDDKYGRATILTTRQIADSPVERINKTETMELTENKEKPALDLSPRDRFVKDYSGSMETKYAEIQVYANEVFGIDDLAGKVDANFDVFGQTNIKATGKDTAKKSEVVNEAGRAAESNIGFYSEVLEKASATLYGDNISPENAKKFANMLGITDQATIDSLVRNGKLDGHILVGALADESGKYSIDVSGKNLNPGGKGESGLKAIITTLLFDNDYKDCKAENKATNPRMNVMVDEPEQAMEYLPLAKALAEAKGVEVRIIAFDTGGGGDIRKPEDATIIDLASFVPDNGKFILSATNNNTGLGGGPQQYDDKSYKWREKQEVVAKSD